MVQKQRTMATKSGNLSLGSLEKWDIATTKKFLKLYRNYRCLWDHTDTLYKDKLERQIALESISNAMNIEGFDTRYVVLKVRALRSTYLYERRKVRLRVKNGEKFQTHLGWFHLADSFLRNYVVEKSYVNGDGFRDPNKDLPPPVEEKTYKTEVNIRNPNFTKDEISQNLYECPKTQLTNYVEANKVQEEVKLHVLEVQQKNVEKELPQHEQLKEIQIKSPVKQTRAQTRKSDSSKEDQVYSKRSKQISEVLTTLTVEDKNIHREGNNFQQKQNQTQQPIQQQYKPIPQQQQNQISYLITGQPATISSLTQQQTETNLNMTSIEQSPSSNNITPLQTDTVVPIIESSAFHKNNDTDKDEFDAFAKSVAMQLRKIPEADAYNLQVKFQVLLSQAKLKAMGKGTISLDLSGFLQDFS